MPSIKNPYMVFMDITSAAIWLVLNRWHLDVLKVIKPNQNYIQNTWQLLPSPSSTDSENREGSKRPEFDITQILSDCCFHNNADQYQMALKEDEGIFSATREQRPLPFLKVTKQRRLSFKVLRSGIRRYSGRPILQQVTRQTAPSTPLPTKIRYQRFP
ncbi:hypothetical protein MMC27_004413 [Xylographa pallens]|nr:hypothetical protein [Xylographa pallens]